ncbi:hypothetical protein [Collimonas sp. PA-H2]|uniref:hypothetical protein n=1 Tax=Collimonas sp. PA-H2 TaxID=1881062 RepID=UPI000BF8D4F7|nr:hypothetical protein [Collimonas sp. PA-H2]
MTTGRRVFDERMPPFIQVLNTNRQEQKIMTPTTRNFSMAASFVVVIAGFSAYLWLLYSAGCAGDAKGGSYGDPVRALQLESYALVPFLFALFTGTALPFMFGTYGLAGRSVVAAIFFVFVGAAFIFLGIQIEFWGIDACFNL